MYMIMTTKVNQKHVSVMVKEDTEDNDHDCCMTMMMMKQSQQQRWRWLRQKTALGYENNTQTKKVSVIIKQ